MAVRAGDPLVVGQRCGQPARGISRRRRDLRSRHQGVHRRDSCREGAATTGHCRRGSRPAAGSIRTARPPCVIWRHPTPRRPVGCTQSTEIISTEGVVLSGSLPPGCELATMYTAAVTTQRRPCGAGASIDRIVDRCRTSANCANARAFWMRKNSTRIAAGFARFDFSGFHPSRRRFAAPQDEVLDHRMRSELSSRGWGLNPSW